MSTRKLTIFLLLFLFISEHAYSQWTQKWNVYLDEGLYKLSTDKYNGQVYVAGTLKGDFDGNGIFEVVVYDVHDLMIHNGLTGQISHTINYDDNNYGENLRTDPLIYDIDNDGRDEIILSFTHWTVCFEYSGGVGVNDTQDFNSVQSVTLSQNYPNPFNPETKIEYSLNKSAFVEVVVFNELGQKVRTLVNNEYINEGKHSVIWDGRNDNSKMLSSGVYYYQIKTEDYTSTKKSILLK